jgi:hypothetical protein
VTLPPEPPPALVPDLDPDTLVESFADPAAARTRADELRREIAVAPDDVAELVSRGDLVDLLRALGDADDALAEAQAAVGRAERVGTPVQQQLARVRLARVHTVRGEFADSTPLFTELLPDADRFGPVIAAYVRHAAGLDAFAQGLWADAREQLTAALRTRDELELDEREATRTALAAVDRRAGSA